MENGGLFGHEAFVGDVKLGAARVRVAYPRMEERRRDVVSVVADAHPNWVTALDVAIGLGKAGSSAVTMKNFVAPALRDLVFEGILSRDERRTAYRYALTAAARALVLDEDARGDGTEGDPEDGPDGETDAASEGGAVHASHARRTSRRSLTKDAWARAVAECFGDLGELEARLVVWSAKLKAKPSTILRAAEDLQVGKRMEPKRRRERVRPALKRLEAAGLMVEPSGPAKKERLYGLSLDAYARVRTAFQSALSASTQSTGAPAAGAGPTRAAVDLQGTTSATVEAPNDVEAGDVEGIDVRGGVGGPPDPGGATGSASDDGPTRVEAARRAIVAATEAKLRRDADIAALESLRTEIRAALVAGLAPSEVVALLGKQGFSVDESTVAGVGATA